MKMRILGIVIGLVLVISGCIIASQPKLTLKCDGQNCSLYKNYFGQIIQRKDKFKYIDVMRCEVRPVVVLTEEGQKNVDRFTLRLMGENIPYTPEWVSKDNTAMSEICTNFLKGKAFKYSDMGALNILKSLWALFVIAGLALIIPALRRKD